MGKILMDTCVVYLYPRAKTQTRARARHPQQVEKHTRTRYPRTSCARGHARVPAA
jgi:hypothetical protein